MLAHKCARLRRRCFRFFRLHLHPCLFLHRLLRHHFLLQCRLTTGYRIHHHCLLPIMARYVYVIALFIYTFNTIVISTSITFLFPIINFNHIYSSTSLPWVVCCTLLFFARILRAWGGVVPTAPKALLLIRRPGARPPVTIIGGRLHSLAGSVILHFFKLPCNRFYLLSTCILIV